MIFVAPSARQTFLWLITGMPPFSTDDVTVVTPDADVQYQCIASEPGGKSGGIPRIGTVIITVRGIVYYSII